MFFKDFRTVMDPLYGSFDLDDFLVHLIIQPEIQRLREVRLSNINSLLLPGGSNISRFEHSLGTAHLANRLSHQFLLPERDRLQFVCAALLHDVGITPFGHLMEEAYFYAGVPFDHEKRLQQVFLGKAEYGNINIQLFEGKMVGFRKVLDYKEFRKFRISVEEIFSIKEGKGPIGELINGTLDLDNIDNVCRMAYHLGIPFRKELPLELIEGFFLSENKLCYDLGKVNLVNEWLDLRERLYSILMLNPIDFAAKSMLVEAVRIGLIGTSSNPSIFDESSWKLTDQELVRVLENYEPTATFMRRLRVSDLFEIIGLFWLKQDYQSNDFYTYESITSTRKKIAENLGCKFEDIIIYLIKDKRYRLITNIIFRDRIDQTKRLDRSLGRKPSELLIGITTRKRELAKKENENICKNLLEELLCGNRVDVCSVNDYANSLADTHKSSQLSLL